jgi:phospho-N-acetylmuramoyl-pentapeptide-transferase
VVLPTLLWGNLENRYVLIVLISIVWLGAVGFLDDYMKIVKKAPKGLLGRYKLAGQLLLGLGIN